MNRDLEEEANWMDSQEDMEAEANWTQMQENLEEEAKDTQAQENLNEKGKQEKIKDITKHKTKNKTNLKQTFTEILLSLGLDRYLFLIGIGIVCMLIASSLEKQQKVKQVSQETLALQQENAKQDKAGGLLEELRLDTAKEKEREEEMAAYEKNNLQSSVDKGSMAYYERYYKQQLEALLSKMEGAGKVSVLVTMKTSEEIVLEKDTPYKRTSKEVTSKEQNSMETQVDSDMRVVFFENDEGRENPIVLKRYAPKVDGIVVLAQGAGNSQISQKISELIMALFDLPAHKIKVAKYRT